MFESLSERLEGALQNIKGEGRISEINIAESLKEVRRALVAADVNYKVAKEFTDRVKEKAMGTEVVRSVSPGQMMVKLVNDELVELMGREHVDLKLEGKPAVILMAGLQGSGKTTHSGKLARLLKSQGKKPLLIAADVYRPAAIDQLHTVGDQVGVTVFSDKESKDPVDIARRGMEHATQNGHEVVIVDTAGRLAIDQAMMEEISRLKQFLKPSESLFVVDAMTGQDAVNTARAFNEVIDFDGVILTKLDGDTRGGAAISIRQVVSKPIKFIGTGEKMDALERFYPDRMASRILGMGDVVSFVERAQQTMDQKEAERLQKKMRKAEFDFEDFLSQLAQIKRMGNLKDLMGMIPGMGKQIKDLDIDDDAFKHVEAIILSMTPAERKNPRLLNASRKKRIAEGSGRSVRELNQLIKQLEQMKKMMKTFNQMGGSGKMPQMPFGGTGG